MVQSHTPDIVRIVIPSSGVVEMPRAMFLEQFEYQPLEPFSDAPFPYFEPSYVTSPAARSIMPGGTTYTPLQVSRIALDPVTGQYEVIHEDRSVTWAANPTVPGSEFDRIAALAANPGDVLVWQNERWCPRPVVSSSHMKVLLGTDETTPIVRRTIFERLLEESE